MSEAARVLTINRLEGICKYPLHSSDGALDTAMSSTPNLGNVDLAKRTENANSDTAAREPRARALLTATVSTFDNALSTPCLVNNHSVSGARITIIASIPLGAEFMLSIPQRNIYRTVRQVWRKGDQLGVAFQTEQAPPMSREETDKDAKIRTLEAEVARLKAEIGVLRNRLYGHEES